MQKKLMKEQQKELALSERARELEHVREQEAAWSRTVDLKRRALQVQRQFTQIPVVGRSKAFCSLSLSCFLQQLEEHLKYLENRKQKLNEDIENLESQHMDRRAKLEERDTMRAARAQYAILPPQKTSRSRTYRERSRQGDKVQRIRWGPGQAVTQTGGRTNGGGSNTARDSSPRLPAVANKTPGANKSSRRRHMQRAETQQDLDYAQSTSNSTQQPQGRKTPVHSYSERYIGAPLTGDH